MVNIKQISPQSNKLLQRLSQIDSPAKSLWYIGELPELAPTVAIVGSRKPTTYGRAISTQLVTELAKSGVTIISGLAIGHDALAHKACLDVGGTTIAIIGNGLNDIHPRSNQGLARQIVTSGGAIFSEYAPDEPVYPSRFLERNRLISGLADIVVIIEANERSGTLNTASHALAQGREVMAVPGNITSPYSMGCNKLIAQGAIPVLSAQDILERLNITKATTKPTKIRFNSPSAQLIYDLINAGHSDGDELLKLSRLDVSEFTLALTMLELNGYIRSLGANNWGLF